MGGVQCRDISGGLFPLGASGAYSVYGSDILVFGPNVGAATAEPAADLQRTGIERPSRHGPSIDAVQWGRASVSKVLAQQGQRNKEGNEVDPKMTWPFRRSAGTGRAILASAALTARQTRTGEGDGGGTAADLGNFQRSHGSCGIKVKALNPSRYDILPVLPFPADSSTSRQLRDWQRYEGPVSRYLVSPERDAWRRFTIEHVPLRPSGLAERMRSWRLGPAPCARSVVKSEFPRTPIYFARPPVPGVKKTASLHTKFV
ncbi:hypothetical protein QBC46DRAFT_345031 [Diplogelasinospora grovesii]|uniref:Uncharacterized protein n=1 Tax=Diplogelasinospora grovesii TaxID=303347 RepID=A0AAN6N0M2_9PEZI|nr:hypothetical protein QBC46DRAFT_345031 [Diplogelasinospora grovesii]